jgi:hypothetical protein
MTRKLVLPLALQLVAFSATVAIAACAAPAGSTPPAPTAAASWHLVLLGDSVLDGIESGVKEPAEARLGATPSVKSWINPDIARYSSGGERSSDMLDRLRSDEALRADLKGADAIWFNVPVGVLLDTCGSPGADRTTLQACLPKALDQYTSDADSIMAAIVAIRPPSAAAIRVVTVWQFLLPTLRRAGTDDLIVPIWRQLNAAVATAARVHGIDLVDAYTAISGSDGRRDAITAGDLRDDEEHLTSRGQARLVDMLVASGVTAGERRPGAGPGSTWPRCGLAFRGSAWPRGGSIARRGYADRAPGLRCRRLGPTRASLGTGR